MNVINSSLKQIAFGVPQGNFPGLILFLICIKKLSGISSNLNFTVFADDTTVTLGGEKLSFLSSQL